MTEYEFPMYNEAGKVICQLCGKPYLIITPMHLRKKHEITLDEYKLRFPEAPISSQTFNNKTQYGKDKSIFVKDELKKFQDDHLQENDSEEIPIEELDYQDKEFNPEIETDFDIKQILKDAQPEDVCIRSKDKVLDVLRNFYTNVKKDYILQIKTPFGILESEFITDFCDPIIKVVIQFPKTFWHNEERNIDMSKNNKLQNAGYKVIEINAKLPTFQQITDAIQSS